MLQVAPLTLELRHTAWYRGAFVMLILTIFSGSAEGWLFHKPRVCEEGTQSRWIDAAPAAAALVLIGSLTLELRYSAWYLSAFAMFMAGVLSAIAVARLFRKQSEHQEVPRPWWLDAAFAVAAVVFLVLCGFFWQSRV